MSQSEAHKELIVDTVQELNDRFPHRKFYVDGIESPGYEKPFSIRNFIPDIYSGRTAPQDKLIIAEAKTDLDFDTSRSTLQMNAFLSYLEDSGNGLFILSVSGRVADSAKTHLCLTCKELSIVNTTIMVFDTLDFWVLSINGVYSWRLF